MKVNHKNSKDQRHHNLAVSRPFRLFGTRLPGDIHTWKFCPIHKKPSNKVWLYDMTRRNLHFHITKWISTWKPKLLIFWTNLVSEGERLPNPSLCHRFRSFSTRFARDIHTWKLRLIVKGAPHGPCGPPFAKRSFCTCWKLPSSCQRRR